MVYYTFIKELQMYLPGFIFQSFNLKTVSPLI